MTHGSGLQNVLAALNQRGARVRSHGSYYTALCPAHDDSNASLSFSQGNEKVVLNCHAGCEVDAIRIGLDLPWTALFDNGGKADGKQLAADHWMPCQMPAERGGAGCSGHKIAEYRYTDEEGNLLFAVARCSRKGDGCKQPFAQWHPDATKKHGKKWGLPSQVRRVPYNLRELLKGAREGRRVWLLEGEKDVDRMKADFSGEVATSAPSGAGKGKWRLEYTRYFAGASEVVIVADCDVPGLQYAEEVHGHLSKIVEKVTVVCTPLLQDGADFSDHRDHGFGLNDFEIVPFEAIEHRPRMAIQVEERHREKPVVFDGFSQESVERSLIGSMLKYGQHYDISEADIRSDKKLQIIAGAIGRIAFRGGLIAPETVAVEVEDAKHSTYEKVLKFALELENCAFSDTDKPTIAARILRERSIREGIVYSCRATEEAARNERWEVGEVLEHLRRLAERHGEEYAQLAHDLCPPVGDAFTVDVLEEVAAEEVAAASNVRELRPSVPAPTRQTAVQRG